MNFKYIKRYGLLALAIAAIHILATNYSNRSVPEDSPQVVLKNCIEKKCIHVFCVERKRQNNNTSESR